MRAMGGVHSVCGEALCGTSAYRICVPCVRVQSTICLAGRKEGPGIARGAAKSGLDTGGPGSMEAKGEAMSEWKIVKEVAK